MAKNKKKQELYEDPDITWEESLELHDRLAPLHQELREAMNDPEYVARLERERKERVKKWNAAREERRRLRAEKEKKEEEQKKKGKR